MASTKREDGWALDQSEFLNNASRNHRGQFVDVYLDDGYLELTAESGSGYMSSSERVYIPLEILFTMLEHAGYRIEYTRGV